MAIGSYNDSIFILGGRINPYQFVEYSIIDNVVIDEYITYLDDATWGFGQFFAQRDSNLFMVDADGDKLSVFNLITKQFQNHWKMIDIIDNVGVSGCLTASDEYIFIIGGNTGISSFQILNISSLSWIIGTEMNQNRYSNACIYHNGINKIYSIGGRDENDIFLNSIETIHVINMIGNQQWEYIQSMGTARSDLKSVVYNDYILIIGGLWQLSPNVPSNDVDIIDTTNDMLSHYPSSLNYAVYAPATIIVNNILFAFGGRGVSSSYYQYSVNTMQYCVLTTSPSTTSPSTTSPSTTSPSTTSPSTTSPSTTSPSTTSPSTTSPSTTSNQMNTDDDNTEIIIISIILFVGGIICVILIFFWKKRVGQNNKNNHFGNKVNNEIELQQNKNNNIDNNEYNTSGEIPQFVDIKPSSPPFVDIKPSSPPFVDIKPSSPQVPVSVPPNPVIAGQDVNETALNHANESVEGMNSQENKEGANEMLIWLNSIGLNSYYDIFTKNGFDSMDMLKEITGKNDLSYIGITLKAHQIKLMNHIKKLKM